MCDSTLETYMQLTMQVFYKYLISTHSTLNRIQQVRKLQGILYPYGYFKKKYSTKSVLFKNYFPVAPLHLSYVPKLPYGHKVLFKHCLNVES